MIRRTLIEKIYIFIAQKYTFVEIGLHSRNNPIIIVVTLNQK